MRVISGVLKGRSINFLKNKNTRPLKDSVKESVFNILKHSNLVKTKIQNSNVLDLYSGIGSFGIECISRGAKKITFVEKDIDATEILKSNLVKLSVFNKTKIYTTNIENFLTTDIVDKFNIFFLDPPFSDIKFLKVLELIKKRKIYKKDYIIIIHREGKSEDKLDDLLKIIETKQYGRSKIIFGLFN